MGRRRVDDRPSRTGTIAGFNYLVRGEKIRPLGRFHYAAKVTRVIQHGDPSIDRGLSSFGFHEHWGATGDDALAKADAEARTILAEVARAECPNRATHTEGVVCPICSP